ncbi:MAG: aminopeptidase, partial [Candidatus Hermodarchaeota archaeon]
MSTEFEQNLEKFAEVIIKVGLNLQPGQRLLIGPPIFAVNGVSLELAPLVRVIVKKAYQAGARLVDVNWNDDTLQLIRIQNAHDDTFEEYPKWNVDTAVNFAETGDAMLVIYAENPNLLIDEDPEKIASLQQTAFKHVEPLMNYVVKNTTNWSVITAPVDGWVDKVFPEHRQKDRKSKFWDIIFEICRIKGDDPVSAWKDHVNQLTSRKNYLNQKQYDTLKFEAPGTDLGIGLPKGHLWQAASMLGQNGINFVANIPTEEVFTIPHKKKTEGFVKCTKPLYFSGGLVEEYQLKFSNGKIVEVSAKKGEKFLKKLIQTDEGASYLGEIALVPHKSPISQSGLLFYNILIDENASNHIALGRGYKFSFKDGEKLSDEDFTALGGNNSLIHIDCMFGSGEMDVDGITKDGNVEPIMRNGEWA